METPFSKRMKQFEEEKKVTVQAYSPVQKPVTAAQPAPLLGDTLTKTPEQLAQEAERKQLTANLESNKETIQRTAMSLRQQVASGQISQADAEHQLDLVVNKLTDNSYLGYGDLDVRQRAAGFGEQAGNAYGMYEMGLDPMQMAREQQRLQAQKGVLSDVGMPTMGQGSEPPMGAGREPMMGGVQ